MPVYDNIEKYLADKKINPVVKSEESLEWYMPLENRSRIYCTLKKETFGWVINMCFPVTADCSATEEMYKTAEFVTRVNSVISSGCFELDWNTGEVKFRYHFAVSGNMATYENIKNILEYIYGVVCTYENAFFSTLFGNSDVKSHVTSHRPPCFPELTEPEEISDDYDDCPPDWGLDDIDFDELYDDLYNNDDDDDDNEDDDNDYDDDTDDEDEDEDNDNDDEDSEIDN